MPIGFLGFFFVVFLLVGAGILTGYLLAGRGGGIVSTTGIAPGTELKGK